MAVAFFGGLEEIRLHFAGGKIEDRLDQALGGNARPRCI